MHMTLHSYLDDSSSLTILTISAVAPVLTGLQLIISALISYLPITSGSFGLVRILPEPALVEVLIAEGRCRQLEDNASVRADDRLLVSAVAAEILEVAAAPDGFHQRIEHHHRFRADAVSVLIDGTAVRALISVTDLFAVAAVSLGLVSVKKARYFNGEFVFFVIPFVHGYVPPLENRLRILQRKPESLLK